MRKVLAAGLMMLSVVACNRSDRSSEPGPVNSMPPEAVPVTTGNEFRKPGGDSSVWSHDKGLAEQPSTARGGPSSAKGLHSDGTTDADSIPAKQRVNADHEVRETVMQEKTR